MIEPEVASRWGSQAAFDRVASVLIGVVAILAAIFAVQQAHEGLAGTRGQVQGARLAADAAARIAASSTSGAAGILARQNALVVGMQGVSRQLAGTGVGDEIAVSIGSAQVSASERLTQAVTETLATTGGEPLDTYTRGLVNATDDEIRAIVAEQNRQVDLADAAGSRQMVAVLGLSLVTLAGVLAGVGAVLGRGKAGWLMLAIAWGVAAVAAVPGLSWLFS